MGRKISSIAPLLVLGVAFCLLRYPLFPLHGMKQWPLVLAIAGIAISCISAFLNRTIVAAFTAIGYGAGFGAGLLFHSRGIDAGGGSTDNLWLIWTAVMACFIVAGGSYSRREGQAGSIGAATTLMDRRSLRCGGGDGMDSGKRVLIVARLLAATVVWFAIQRAYSVFADPLLEDAIPRLPRMVLASMIVPYTIGLGALYLIVRSMEARTPSGNTAGVSPAAIGRYFVIQSGLSFPMIVITNIATMMLGGQITGLTSGEILGNLPFYIFLLLIFNPLFEEVLFRKLILERLTVLGTRSAIICSAVLFALPHAFSLGLAQMLYTFILGLVWGYVTVGSGRLLPAIVLHSLSNIYGTFIPMIPRSLPIANLAFMAVYVLIMPIAAIVLAVREHKRVALQSTT